MPTAAYSRVWPTLLLPVVAAFCAAAPPNTYYQLPRSPYRTSALFAPYETQNYRVENFGFYYSSLYQPFGPHRYPGPNDVNPAGLLGQTFDSAVGDFNGDGWQDVVLNLTGTPETADRFVDIRPVVFLNDRKGGLYYDPTIFDGLPPARLFTTRVMVADFNGDGVDDFVGTGFGMIRWNADGTRNIIKEAIPLVLSQPGGKLKDASGQIEGQENGGPPPGFDFGHDLAVGDINGDGFPDFYQGRFLFLNDGHGSFRNATAQLPARATPAGIPMMSSAIADLNGDGFGDLVCGYFPSDVPGYIILSNGKSILTESSPVLLPPGPFGTTNTRQNHMAIRDLDGDGRPDLVIGQTRGQPYYEGRVLQIIMNRGGGVFVDETSARIDNSLRWGSDTSISNPGFVGDEGEGQLSLVDANGDGFADIIDQTSFVAANRAGVTIFLNDGTGRFTHSPSSAVAFVPKFAVAGIENFQANAQPVYMPRPVPVDLDKQLGIDFVGHVLAPAFGTGYSADVTFYTVRNIKPLGATPVAPVIVTQPASQAVGAYGSALLSVTATGNPAPTYQWKFNGTDLTGQNSPQLSLNQVSPERNGSYTVVVSNAAGTVTSDPAVISAATLPAAGINPHPQGKIAAVGSEVVLTSGTPATVRQWYHNGVAIPGATDTTLTLRNVQLSDAGFYVLIGTRNGGATRSNGARLTVTATTDAPAIVVPPASETVAFGGDQPLIVGAAGALPLSVDWRKDGVSVAGAGGPRLGITNAQSSHAGVYTATIANSLGTAVTQPVILGVSSTAKVVGTGTEIAGDILHPTGRIFDQILLQGAAATITADPGQVTRISYIDLSNDIVQVEFAGAGSLSLILYGASGPAAPVNYNQGVEYMKGHAGIVIMGADETTNVSVFSVGRGNAVNQALFRDEVGYDGWADLAYIAILSANGKFGGVRTANASYWADKGLTGIYAPNVQFTGPVFVGNINASGSAAPVLRLGSGSDVRVTGGNLLQTNGQAVQVSGIASLRFADGSTSHNGLIAAQQNKARLEQDGTDLTAQIVLNP